VILTPKSATVADTAIKLIESLSKQKPNEAIH